jgi:outer membrane protein assembly factor BamB
MKRFVMRWVVLALAIAGLAGDWPQLLGPDRNGTTVEKDLIDTFTKDGPRVVWQHKLGEGYASPVIAQGKLIIFHRVDNDDIIECLAAATGKPVWKYTYRTDYRDNLGKGDGPRSTPVIAGDKVYLLGAAGKLLCLTMKSGEKVWQKYLIKSYTVPQSYFGVGTTPLVEGKVLLVNVGGEGAGIVAFDKETGKEVWKSTEDGASYSSPIAATIDGARHVFFFTRQGLVSLDPADGKVRFKKPWRARYDASVNAAMPVLVAGDHLLLTASYETGAVLLKVRKDGVDEAWRSKTALSAHFSTPVAVGEQLYGFDGRQEVGAQLRCIDWKTGKVRWTEAGFGCGSMIAAGKKLYVLSERGELVIVEASGERYVEKAWAAVLDAPCRAHLALAEGLLYARDGGKLVCWRLTK